MVNDGQNNEQEISTDDSSQSDAISTDTVETQNEQVEQIETPSTTQPQNISDVIIENANPKQGFLTSSGTYVNVYKNAGNNERTYTSDNTVNPAGQRIDPSSAEGQVIQNQYALQADRRVENQAQSERFWAIRGGQGSVKNVLYDNQTPEQRRLTDLFFDERNLDINTPLNQLSLSPKRYTDQRAQLMSGDDVTNRTVSSPDDKIWLKTDTPTQSTLKTFDQYKSDIVTRTQTPSSNIMITGASVGSEWSNVTPSPINDSQKELAKEMVDDQLALGNNFITFTREREGVADSTITIPITGTNAYSKIGGEFNKSNLYGGSNDTVIWEGHVEKNEFNLPEKTEKITSIPMMDGIPHFIGGSLLFHQLYSSKKETAPTLDVITESSLPVPPKTPEDLQAELDRYWVLNEDGTPKQKNRFTGEMITDYRSKPELGYLAPLQQYSALGISAGAGIAGQDMVSTLQNTPMMDTALDSFIRVVTAFNFKSDGTQKAINPLNTTPIPQSTDVKTLQEKRDGLYGVKDQLVKEIPLWQEFAPYYYNTIQTDISMALGTLPIGGVVARVGGSVAKTAVVGALKAYPSLTPSSQLLIAGTTSKMIKLGVQIPANLFLGGIGKDTSKITLASVQAMTAVDAKAYGLEGIHNVVTGDPLLRNFDLTPENAKLQNEEANFALEAEFRMGEDLDEINYSLMGRTSQEGGLFDAGDTSIMSGAKRDNPLQTTTLRNEQTVIMPQEGFPQLVDSPLPDTVFYRDPISTQSPLMREVNFGRSVSGAEMDMIDTYNFDYLRKQPLTTRGNPIAEQKAVFKMYEEDNNMMTSNVQRPTNFVDPEKMVDYDDMAVMDYNVGGTPTSRPTALGTFDDMANSPLGFIDDLGQKVRGRETFEQALPQNPFTIGDKFVETVPLKKLPPATIGDITIKDNQVRFKVFRGSEEYLSMSTIDPKTKKPTYTQLVGVNWYDFNKAKQTFVYPSPNTIKNLMLIQDSWETKFPRFNRYTDGNTGVWKIPQSEPEKMQALRIRYLNDEKYVTGYVPNAKNLDLMNSDRNIGSIKDKDGNIEEFFVVKDGNEDISNILRLNLQQIEVDTLKGEIKDMKSGSYKYLNNLFAPKKSKIKDSIQAVITRNNRQKKADKITKHLKSVEEKSDQLRTLEAYLPFTQKKADRSVMKLWGADVERMFVERQTAEATSKLDDIVGDPIFANLPMSITQSERLEIAKVTARLRYQDVAQDDFINISRVLDAKEIDAINTISRLELFTSRSVESAITGERNSPAFGKSVIEYIDAKKVLTKATETVTTSVGLTDNFKLLEFKNTVPKLDKNGNPTYVTNKQVMDAEENVRRSLLNIQGNEASYQFGTTGMSAQIRESVDMRGKSMEWTNPKMDVDEQMELNTKAQFENVQRKKELVEELETVDFKLANIEKNIDTQKLFAVATDPDDFISTKLEPVTAEELAMRNKFYRLSKDYLESEYDNTKPVVEKLDQDFGKPTTKVGQEGIKGGIPDIAKIIPSSKEDVLRTKDDLDLGFKSDAQTMDDLMDMARDDALTNPQSGKLIDEMEKILWKQNKIEPTIGTGIDGIVRTGRKEHSDVIEQMRRIDEQKLQVKDYNMHTRMMNENKAWLDRRFNDEQAVTQALRDYKSQTVVKSDDIFVIGQGTGTNPINSQSSMWKNRIETPESDYLKLMVKRENINQQLGVAEYKIASQKKKILTEGYKDENNEWIMPTGLAPELVNQKKLVISAIVKSEEDKMLREAFMMDDYLVAPKKSNKQSTHVDYSRRQALADEISMSGGYVSEQKLKQMYKYRVPKEGGDARDVEALSTLLDNYNKIKKARTKELEMPVQTPVFADNVAPFSVYGSFSKPNIKRIVIVDPLTKKPLKDPITGKTVTQKITTQNLNMQRPRSVVYSGVTQNVQLPTDTPMFMKYDYGDPKLPRVLGENQERRLEIVNLDKTGTQTESRVTFFDKKPVTTKSGESLGYTYQLVPDKRKTSLTTENDLFDLKAEGYVKSVDYRWERKVYKQKETELKENKDSLKTLQDDTVRLTTQGDVLTKGIDDTPSELKLRFGNLDQVAPDKRKLQELDNLRQVTVFEQKTLKSDIKDVDKNIQKLSIDKQMIKEPTNVPVDSITPLGGQFAISSSRMTDKQARQLSFVLPQIGTSKNFRVIENMIDNNEYFKGQVWFENVYYDKAGTDLGVTGSATFKIPEQQQAWDKIKLVEQKYDNQVGASYVMGGSDNTPRRTGQVIQEIENMIRISDPPKNPMVSMVDNSRTNPNLGSQKQYGYEGDMSTNPLDKTDPKLVAKYEKDFLNQLKDKYKLHGKLIDDSDKLNKKKNELTDTLATLESNRQHIRSSNPYEYKGQTSFDEAEQKRDYNSLYGKTDTDTPKTSFWSSRYDSPEYTAKYDKRSVNQNYLDSLDTTSTPSTPSAWNPRIIQNKISIGIQKKKLDGQISHTNKQLNSINGKISENQSKLDEVRTSRLDSFQVNENIKSDHLILEDKSRWMHFDENLSSIRGKKPDEQGMPKPDLDNNDPSDITLLPTFNQEHTRLLTPLKTAEEKKKVKGVSSYRSLQRILDNNAVSTAYGQQPIPVLPFAVIRYPEGTPQEIQDNVGIMEMPQPLDFAQPQQGKSFTEPFNNSPMNPPITSFDTTSKSVVTTRGDIGNMFRTSSDLKLGTINSSRQLAVKPVIVAQAPVVTPAIKQGNLLKLYPVEALKPLSMSGVIVAPKPIVQQRAPIPLPVWNAPLPYTKRPKRKKEKPKKVKKKKVYWDVPSTPFEPFNPKEYYTFKNEPRSIKFKEKRRNFDGNLPK